MISRVARAFLLDLAKKAMVVVVNDGKQEEKEEEENNVKVNRATRCEVLEGCGTYRKTLIL